MKLIEYKPIKNLIIDVSQLPENIGFDPNDILNIYAKQKLEWQNSNVKVIVLSEPWVHPDYRVKEDKYIAGHDPYHSKDENPGEIKIYKKSDSFHGNSLDHLYIPFPDPEGLNPFIDYKVWEAAKPKLNPEFGKILVFGTSGESDRDIAKEFGIPLEFTDDDFEIHWLSESHIQEAEWRERKRKCPSLTVQDLRWVDKMVDEIYEKHTRNHSREAFYYHIENYTRSGVNKFFGPFS